MVHGYIAQKYDVDFQKMPFYSDEIIKTIRKIQTNYCEDIVLWENDGDESDFELSIYELKKLILNPEVDSASKNFALYLINNCDPDLDYVKIQLW